MPFAEGVPITLQTLGVMLAGAILGARKGFLAVLTFEALTFAGLPLLAGGRGGPLWFLSSVSAGFLWGWLPGVALVGLLTGWILPRYRLWLGILVTAAGGMVVIYCIGIPVLAVKAHLSLATAAHANVAFLPGDAVKVTITALVAKRVHRAYPGLIGTRARRPAARSTSPLG